MEKLIRCIPISRDGLEPSWAVYWMWSTLFSVNDIPGFNIALGVSSELVRFVFILSIFLNMSSRVVREVGWILPWHFGCAFFLFFIFYFIFSLFQCALLHRSPIAPTYLDSRGSAQVLPLETSCNIMCQAFALRAIVMARYCQARRWSVGSVSRERENFSFFAWGKLKYCLI